MAGVKFVAVLVVAAIRTVAAVANPSGFRSVLGDPGMRSNRTRVALESWNFCNEVGFESRGIPSPRLADCADLYCTRTDAICQQCAALQRVEERDNALAPGVAFPSGKGFSNYEDPDQYAVQKELYLGSLCEVKESYNEFPWYFWTIMLKNGNYDITSGECPYGGRRLKGSGASPTGGFGKKYFPCFGKGCMNHPVVYHNWSRVQCDCESGFDSPCKPSKVLGLKGSFYGSYDLGAEVRDGVENVSYFSVDWEKNPRTGSWMFRHKLKVSGKYPWLMLYLRADTVSGLSGGYPYETRGLMKAPASPNFRVRLTLNVLRGGGPQSQFYLIDIGGCWKNDGRQCDGDVQTDVTRYSEMIINPQTGNACSRTNLAACPPYHTTATGKRIHRNNTALFPYAAYHYYCIPSNAKDAEKPFNLCDPFSNPQPQELVQLLPHPEWAVHGFPSAKGQGWIGDPRTWDLDVGSLSSRLYFYQDIGSKPAKRLWPSVDVGTEIFKSPKGNDVAEWTLSDFDVVIRGN